MAFFSENSMRKLDTCDGKLIRLFMEVVREYDCAILYGYRDREIQDRLYEEGRSKLKYPNSKHNSYPSRAVDVAPYPIDWDDVGRFYHFAGYVSKIAKDLNIPLRWGGDWDGDGSMKDQTFNDLVHFELG